jgi:hypothetical protein
MRARHTQARLQCRAITSKALVNRARMKVVNIALTSQAVVPAKAGTHNHLRLRLRTGVATTSLKSSGHGVWVPASAHRR